VAGTRSVLARTASAAAAAGTVVALAGRAIVARAWRAARTILRAQTKIDARIPIDVEDRLAAHA
jgi:hypothetical protein